MDLFNLTDFSNDTRYAQAVARVRVLETKLLPARKFVRMAEREDWEAVLDELRGTDYAEALVHVKSSEELESALLATIENRYRLLHELAIEPRLIDSILSWHDFNNLRILLKAELKGTARNFPLSPLGIIDPAMLKDHLENHRSLPAPLDAAQRAAMNDYATHKSQFRVETLLDRFYLDHVRKTFESSGIRFLNYFINYRIDLAKIRDVIRWRDWTKNQKPAQPDTGEKSLEPSKSREKGIDWQLLPAGGFLPDDKIHALSTEEWDKLPALLQYTPYGNLFASAMDHHRVSGDWWLLEKLAEDFVTEFCRLARYTPFGVEPLIAFLWFNLQELKNVRMVVTAKYIRLAPAEVKPRLRLTHE
jgi:V/A-type H+-transporting ATPase subunit C